ncbi:MAG: trigger factor [Hyphomicrobiaceae bacterium]
MEVIETSNDGLKRQLKVVVGAGELGDRFTARLDEIKDRVQIKGFRPGKVPVAHLKKVYGRSLMAEVLQQAVEESSQKALADRNERPAMQPKIELPEQAEEIEKVIAGQADLSYSMSFEVLPKIAITDLAQLKLERLTAAVEDKDIDKAVDTLAERNVKYVAEEGRAAGTGDQVSIDFVGKIDGEAFEGGTGQDVQVILGQGNFIPGFEEGIAGAKAGDQRTVTATFPEAYSVETLKGKTATFDVTVKEVAKSEKPTIDDTFASSLGAENVAKLRELVSAQIGREYEQAARSKLKRQLLDALEKAHDFTLPPTLVDSEFAGIWQQVEQGLKQAGKTFADEGKSEDEMRVEYRAIAERRVRLGLVIGEIGEQNKIQVSQDELRRALVEQARRFPGQEKMVYEYYEKNPAALAELRAPIFEDKVVDYIVELARPTVKTVSSEELLKPEEDAA